ncbi:hypothetical protein [Actinomyces sp. HMT897]|uniref:hypothetical protein n=1 Tax=Actinomyces sp. HMT897 TaxID=2789424 RepID=UPI00190D46F1|nr:hypothetical protein [Actinomyces sp. HMT897]QQO78858.1 hypothetical protein JJJ15_06255 [Actinomyces sp. HMT897]
MAAPDLPALDPADDVRSGDAGGSRAPTLPQDPHDIDVVRWQPGPGRPGAAVAVLPRHPASPDPW